MRTSQMFKRTALALLLVALLSLFSLSSAFADEDKSFNEKITKLEAMIKDLESVVKSLTLQVQRVSETAISDLESFRPRLFSVENLTKDNTFEIKKLSGTVAKLSEMVEALRELPGQVSHLKTYLKDVDAKLSASIGALSNRMGAIELAVMKLQESVEQTLVVTHVFQESVGKIFNRLDAAESILGALHGGIGSLAARLDDVERRTSQLQSAVAQVDSLSAMFSQVQVNLAELAARQDRSEARAAQLRDMVERLAMQVERLQAQLGETQPKEPTRPDGTQAPQIERLASRLAEVVMQLESNQRAIVELQQSITRIKEEIRVEVLASIPRVPSEDMIRIQIEEVTAKQLKEALARADAAQGLAIVALLAGIGAIVAALLL
jgi:chromosome segregation ATPase